MAKLKPEKYWRDFEQIALEHLLLYEEDPELDRDDLFATAADRLARSESP